MGSFCKDGFPRTEDSAEMVWMIWWKWKGRCRPRHGKPKCHEMRFSFWPVFSCRAATRMAANQRLPILCEEKECVVRSTRFTFGWFLVTVIVLFWKFSRCGFSEVLSSWRQVTKVKLAVNNVDSALNLVTGKNFAYKNKFFSQEDFHALAPWAL